MAITKGSKRGRHVRPRDAQKPVSNKVKKSVSWNLPADALEEEEAEATETADAAAAAESVRDEEVALREMMAERTSTLLKPSSLNYPTGHSDAKLIQKMNEKGLPRPWVKEIPTPRDDRFLRLSGGERFAGVKGTVVFREDVLIEPVDFRHLGMIHVVADSKRAAPGRLQMTMEHHGFRGDSLELPRWVQVHKRATQDLRSVGGWALIRYNRLTEWMGKGEARAGGIRHFLWTTVMPTVIRSRTLDLVTLRLRPATDSEMDDAWEIVGHHLHSMEVASALGWWPLPPALPFWRTLKGLASVPEHAALMLLGQGIEAESGCAAAEALLAVSGWKRGDFIDFVDINAGMGQYADCLERVNGEGTVQVVGVAECWDAALLAHSVAHGDHTTRVTVWAHVKANLDLLGSVSSITHAHYSMICSPFSRMCRIGGSIFSEERQERIEEVLCQLASVMRWLAEVGQERGLRGISIENVDRLLEQDLAEVWDRILQITEAHFPRGSGWTWKQMVMHPHIDFGGVAIRARLYVVGGRHGTEAFGHGGSSSAEVPSDYEGLSDYEVQRQKAIEENHLMLAKLGLEKGASRAEGKKPEGAGVREGRLEASWSSIKWDKLQEDSVEAWAMLGKLGSAQFRDGVVIDGTGPFQDVVEFVEKPVVWINPPPSAMSIRVVKAAPEALLHMIETTADKIPWDYWEPVINQTDEKRRQYILDEAAYGKSGPYRSTSFGEEELAGPCLDFGQRVAKFCGISDTVCFPSLLAVQEGAVQQGMHQDVADGWESAVPRKWSMAISIQERKLDFLVEGRATVATVQLTRGDVIIFDSRLCHGGAAFPFLGGTKNKKVRASGILARRYILFMYVGEVTKSDRENIHACRGTERAVFAEAEERRSRLGRGRVSRMLLEP